VNGAAFDSINFGELSSNTQFILKGGQLKTYKNGTDDITGAAMYYRIYKQGISPLPSFDTLNLPWKEETQSPLGSIDQTWEQNGFNFNILNGLADGDYFIEIYFEAFYTDQTGAHIHYDNNGGNNYIASFSINNCPLELGNNLTFCSAFDVTLNATPGNASYYWSTGDTVSSIVVSQAGTYIVTITNPSCTAKDSITIYTGTSSFVLEIGNDTTVCGLGLITMNTGGGFTSYQWSTGDTLSSIQVITGGLYTVTVSTTDNCLLMDERQINFRGLPQIEIGSNFSICNGDSVILDAGYGFASYLWSDNSQNQQITLYDSGIYSVTVTDSAGCEGFDVVTINTSEVPDANFSFVQGQGLEINFTDLSQHSTQNYWDFLGNNIFTAYNVGDISYTYPFAGIYTVKMIASNSCSSDTSEMIINVSTSVTEVTINDTFSVYPNPSDGRIYLKVSDKAIVYNINIKNAQNQIIKEIKTHDENTSKGRFYTFDISFIDRGIYFIEIVCETGIFYKKIIIN